jgi:4-amino-4-deoxy-L-arabinose transferase-like glycosyltransferase
LPWCPKRCPPLAISQSANVRIPFWVFVLIAAVYALALRVDIMDIDASQYAEISREMARSGSYLQVFDRGANYLDKPPMLFWLSSLSIRLFGVNDLGYRLPSLIMALVAVYATYRLARLLYNETTGRIAALVLATCQGFFLWTLDVRTDMMLTGFVALALWCIRECETRRRWYFVLGGTAGIAGALMTKGPIGLFVPLFAFGADWALRRDWKRIFSPWHLLDLAIIAVFLIPMSIGLYQQYDLHPEKIIDGQTGTSGLRFFYWTQSFGRITGESTWNNGADPFFLLQSMLWAFLPWMFIFLPALFLNVRQLFRQRFRLQPGQEWVSTGGFILTYLSLCISKYQLPHYILVAFPLAAIMVAKLLADIIQGGALAKLGRVLGGIQIGVTGLLLFGALLIVTFVFPAGWAVLALWLAAVCIWIALVVRRYPGRILWISAGTMILINVFVTNFFYYPLMGYQLGNTVGKYLKARGAKEGEVIHWLADDPLNSVHYYAGLVVTKQDTLNVPGRPGNYVLTRRHRLRSYDSAGKPYEILKTGGFYKVSELSGDFMNPATRDSALKYYALILLR